MIRKLALLAPVTLAAAACSTPAVTSPDHMPRVEAHLADGSAPFQTDSSSYTLARHPWGYEVKLGVVFTNPRAEPVHIANCMGATGLQLERYEEDAWIPVLSPPMPLCLSAPIVIAPGAKYPMTVHLMVGLPDNNFYPKFDRGDPRGTYRIVWTALYTTDNGDDLYGEQLPLDHRRSNSFTLE